jgi:uncharacterized membrane protein
VRNGGGAGRSTRSLDVMTDESRGRHRFIQIGLVVLGVTSIVAHIAMVLAGIEKVNTGHGLDTYRTFWLIRFNWVGFLVLIVAIGVALIGVGWFRYLEWRELDQLRKRYLKEGHDV